MRIIKERRQLEEKYDECAVCLDDLFEEDGRGDVSQIKQCGHCFHTECIKEWFKKDLSCPSDREPL